MMDILVGDPLDNICILFIFGCCKFEYYVFSIDVCVEVVDCTLCALV